MLCLSGFELHSRWMPLLYLTRLVPLITCELTSTFFGFLLN